MQLFILSEDPVEAAIMACDDHVIKICTEVGQILNAALSKVGVATRWKVAYKNHPLSLWVNNRSHALWAHKYGIALCEEYTLRYHKRHKTHGFLESLDLNPLVDSGWSGFLPCVPEEFKNSQVVEAYRNYYRGDRIRSFATWKFRPPPSWWE